MTDREIKRLRRVARGAIRSGRFDERLRADAVAIREDPDLAADLSLRGNLIHSAAGNVLHGLEHPPKSLERRGNLRTAVKQLKEAYS